MRPCLYYLFDCDHMDVLAVSYFYCRSMLKLLDILVQLDHLKNAKASIPNDFSWYKRYAFDVSWTIEIQYDMYPSSQRLLSFEFHSKAF